MSSSCREALPVVREWSGDPTECPAVVRSPPGCLGVVGRLSQMSRSPYGMIGSGREALLNVREWSAGPP